MKNINRYQRADAIVNPNNVLIVRSSVDDPMLIDRIVEFRCQHSGGNGQDPMDEYSTHYAIMDQDNQIKSTIMMTRLGANTTYIEDQFDPMMPEALRPRAVFAGFLVASGGFGDYARVVAAATAAEKVRGARFSCMLIQKNRMRPYIRMGLVPTKHALIKHPRTLKECVLMIALPGLVHANSLLYDSMNFHPSGPEFMNHRDYFEKLGVDTSGFGNDFTKNKTTSNNSSEFNRGVFEKSII